MTETMPNPAGLRTPRPQRPWLRAPLALGYALAFALFAWWLDRRMLGVARDTYFGWFVLGNALPGLVLAGLLTAATRRPGVSFLVVAALQWLVYHACAIKLDILDDPIGFRVSDVEFHRRIAEATENPFLVRVSTSLYILGMEYRRIAAETPGVLGQSFRDHEQILAALEARDPDAAEAAMVRHMTNVHQSTVDAMDIKT